MKKLLSALLALMLLIPGAVASDAGLMESQYSDCIIRLNDYLLNAKDVEIDLDQLKADFEALGNYDNGNAALFALYTQVLVNLRDVHYAECEAPLLLLDANAEKVLMVMLTYPDLYALGDIPTLEKYCEARMCEVQGDYARAFELYGSITSFYDSMARASACYGRGGVTLTATPTAAPAATPQPQPQGEISTITARCNNYSITVKWEASGNLTSYTLYRRCDSRNEAFQKVISLDANAEKKHVDYDVVAKRTYTYYVEGVDTNGNTVESSSVQIYADLKGNSSNTNTNKNTNINSNNNSSASSSSSSASASSDNTNINNNTQNITIVIPTEKPAEWSAWSEWSTTPAYASSTREVESITMTEVGSELKYNYSRYRYIGKNGNNWYYPEYYRGDNYVRGGEWQYKTVDEPLTVTGTAAGETLYEGNWYHETIEENEVVLATWIEYRYRDRIN